MMAQFIEKLLIYKLWYTYCSYLLVKMGTKIYIAKLEMVLKTENEHNKNKRQDCITNYITP